MDCLVREDYDASRSWLFGYTGIDRLTVFWGRDSFAEAFEDCGDEGSVKEVGVMLDGFVKGGRSEERQLVERYFERRGRRDAVALIAHGFVDGGRWFARNGDGRVDVSEWIEGQDGRYGLIMAFCCNPSGVEVETSRSLLWYGSKDINSKLTDDEGVTQRDLFLPGFGLVNGYIMDDARRHVELMDVTLPEE